MKTKITLTLNEDHHVTGAHGFTVKHISECGAAMLESDNGEMLLSVFVAQEPEDGHNLHVFVSGIVAPGYFISGTTALDSDLLDVFVS